MLPRPLPDYFFNIENLRFITEHAGRGLSFDSGQHHMVFAAFFIVEAQHGGLVRFPEVAHSALAVFNTSQTLLAGLFANGPFLVGLVFNLPGLEKRLVGRLLCTKEGKIYGLLHRNPLYRSWICLDAMPFCKRLVSRSSQWFSSL